MRKSVVLGLAVALLVSVVGCASIALEEVSGETEAVTVRAKDGAIAVGPFRYLSTDWLPIGQAWVWGDTPEGQQIYAVVDPQGPVQTCLIPDESRLAGPNPLSDGSGCAGISYPSFTAWVHLFSGETRQLGPAEGLLPGPKGDRLLLFGSGRTVLIDIGTGMEVEQPDIPAYRFPYAGAGIQWVDEDAVLIQEWENDRTGVRVAKVVGAEQVAKYTVPGQVLSPYVAPGGAWLALLAGPADEAVVLPEAVFPIPVGRTLSIYRADQTQSQARLAAGAGRMISDIIWSPDAGFLAYVEAERMLIEDAPVPELAFGDDGKVLLAAAPGFECVELPLPNDRIWLPVSFAPGNRYLAVRAERTGEIMIWDLVAEQMIVPPVELAGGSLHWYVADTIFCQRCPTDAWLTWHVPSGKLQQVDLPIGCDYYWAGEHVSFRYSVAAGATVPAFGQLKEGEWLLVYPLSP